MITMKIGDVVLVQNDFSTPEEWEYPATIVSIDTEYAAMADVKPLSQLINVAHDSDNLPVFANQCKSLIKGKLKESYLDGPTRVVEAYLDQDTKKVYFGLVESDSDSFLEQEMWFEADSGEIYKNVTVIGELEEQSE